MKLPPLALIRCIIVGCLSFSLAFAESQPAETPAETPVETQGSGETGVRWKPLLFESLFFLGVEHGFRLTTQDYTRHYLRGKFFNDWGDAIANLHGWADGDPFLINYIGHPMQGSVTGFLFVANDPKYQRTEFGRDRDYWKSRARATLFAFAFSEQFEIGPLSEASIGNTSSYYPQLGLVDHVITPTLGLVWMIGEDAIDKYIITRLEQRTKKRWLKIAVRGGLNPSRSMANAMRLEYPWHRDTRSDNLSHGTVRVASAAAPAERFRPRDELLPGPAGADPSPDPAGIQPIKPLPRDSVGRATRPTFEVGGAYSYTRLATGKPGALSCNGADATAALNLNNWLSFTADVGGCKMLAPGENISGDSLNYMVGPRITFRNATAWEPFVLFLVGGDKLSTETLYPELRPAVVPVVPEREKPALHASYTSADQTNAFAIKFGLGVDRVVNKAFAIRMVEVDDTHIWARLLNGRHYPNNVGITTGVIVRFGTW